MAFRLTIESDFGEEDRQAEIVDILHAVADKVQEGYAGGLCKDSNGNTVGDWEIT